MKTDPQWLNERLRELYETDITLLDWQGEEYRIPMTNEVVAAIINAEIIVAAISKSTDTKLTYADWAAMRELGPK